MKRRILASFILLGLPVVTAFAQPFVWTGVMGDGNPMTAGNWEAHIPAVPRGDGTETLQFGQVPFLVAPILDTVRFPTMSAQTIRFTEKRPNYTFAGRVTAADPVPTLTVLGDLDFGFGGDITFDATLGVFLPPGQHGVIAESTPGVVLGNVFSIKGPISGPGTFQVAGDRTVALYGNNAHAGTQVVNGTLKLYADGAAGGGPIQITNGSVYVFSPASVANVLFSSASNRVDFVSDAAAQSFRGSITGPGSVWKEDRAILTMTGNNAYTGGTSVQGGSLVAGPGTTAAFGTGTIGIIGDILAPSIVAAADGARIENLISMGSLAIRPGTVPSGPVILAGTGFMRYAVLTDNATIAPGDAGGNAVGTLSVGSLTFSGGSTYEWNVAGPAASDRIVLTGQGGGLVTATAASPFILRLVSLAASGVPGRAPGFSRQVYDWDIISGTLDGFSPSKVMVDTSRFSSDAGAGQFSVNQTATGLRLTFTPDGLGPSPRIAVAPSRILAAGNGFTLTASADNPVTSYRWFRNGSLIAGAGGASYNVSAATVSDAGAYTVEVTGAEGVATSDPANLVITPTRLSALSVRSIAGAGSNTLVAGLVVNGASRKDIMVRAIGPSLAQPQYGSLAGVLSQTLLSTYTASGTTAFLPLHSLRWTGDAAMVEAASRVGLAPLAAPSDDSVFMSSVAPGVYTTQVTNQLSGLALMEVYDLGTATDRSRLTALSVRSSVGPGDRVLIVGFIVSGTAPLRLVLRGLGPALIASGISGTLVDPVLGVYSGGTLVVSNNDWGGGTGLAAAFAGVGLPALAAGSTDAALLVTLAPGVYTAQLSGAGTGTGVGLLEIYEAP